MWGIREGSTKFIHTMKVVPPKVLESNVHLGVFHSTLYS
jgi:hypothetical protein